MKYINIFLNISKHYIRRRFKSKSAAEKLFNITYLFSAPVGGAGEAAPWIKSAPSQYVNIFFKNILKHHIRKRLKK